MAKRNTCPNEVHARIKANELRDCAETFEWPDFPCLSGQCPHCGTQLTIRTAPMGAVEEQAA